MKNQYFKLIPTPEFEAEIERIAKQYEGFQRVKFTGRFIETHTPSLIINAWYLIKDKNTSITVEAHSSELLMARFYQKLAEVFEPDFYPVDQLV